MKKVTESFKKKTLFFERFLFKDVFLESVDPKCHFVISYNGFILKQLQANNQLNHNNQQENINSWKAQAIFPPQCSQFSEEFSSPVPSSRRSNFTTLSPNPSEGYPLNEHIEGEPQTPKTMESFKKGISLKGGKGIVPERTWTKEDIESLITLWEQSEMYVTCVTQCMYTRLS